jgi:glutathione synthase/RimK-type ligase-like ATP-grasp enzyme
VNVSGLRVLIVWERTETNSWNPILADRLRGAGADVVAAHSFAELDSIDLRSFDVCLPRFRECAAAMTRVDEALSASGIPLLNTQRSRRACEDKAVSHYAFQRAGLAQPNAVVVDAEGSVDANPGWSGETRSEGIEILDSPAAAIDRAREREEDLLVQQMIWPARSWRVIVGRNCGCVDPYWRRPPEEAARVHAISTGSTIVRDPVPDAVLELAEGMLEAVDGQLLAADVLEHDGEAWALEINHNFDAHGGDDQAFDAFCREMGELVADAPLARA